MEKIIYPLQKKLFDKIATQYRDRAAAITHYRKKFHFSRSKAYAHFNGERSIEGDFMLQLMSEYGYHDLDIWPDGWPETHFMVTVSTLQPSLEAALAMLSSDMKHLRRNDDRYLFQAVGDLPVVLLKTRRRLAAFLLFYHLNFELFEPRLKHVKFGTAFMNMPQISAWLDGLREALHYFHEIPGTEYWSPTMLDSLLVKLNFVRVLEDFEAPGEFHHLSEEVHILIHEMEKMVERGTKLSGCQLQVYNHQGLLHNNIMVGESGTCTFLYLNYGLMDLHRYQHPNAVETYLARIKRANVTALPLSNLKNRRDFFTEMRTAVDRQLAC